MIVTLAGHVDHGKTTLVRLLTGKDTDRLAEEKRRGLTIDLGFAYLTDGAVTVGFVDVPGHHRFIHNMVAGVAAMQHALLVVAADDGPMPQSREHLQILELLGLKEGVVALTKCDRAARSRIGEAREEVASLTAGTFLKDAPVIETSAATGEGLGDLRAHLLSAAAVHPAADTRPFRMAVDRVFSLKGAGLVLTGTVHSGRVEVDDEVHVFPSNARLRARDLRVQDRPATSARCGDRAAINVGGHDGSPIERGHWLTRHAQPGHRNLVVDLVVLKDFPREVGYWSPVHVYHATSHCTARLAPLEANKLAPGARGLSELVLDTPMLAKHGDRVIVRDQALERTLGGGSVLDNRPWPGRRRAPARLRAVAACALDEPVAALTALLAQGPVDIAAFQGLWDLKPDDLDRLLAAAPATTVGGWLISEAVRQRWREDLLTECRSRHEQNPTLQGLRENEFESPVPAEFRARLLADLVASGELTSRTGRFFPHAHRVELSAAERNLLERLQPLLDQTQPPSLGDLSRTLRIPLTQLRSAVKPLASKGMLVQVNDKRIYLLAHLDELAQAAEELSRRGPFSAADFRDAAAIGRNVAIDVLEYFDAKGFTRRQGETRVVVTERSRLLARLR